MTRQRSRRFPNVETRLRKDGPVYRCRVLLRDKIRVGPWRDSPEEAHGDLAAVRARWLTGLRADVVTLCGALAAVVKDGRARGLERITLRNHLISHSRFLLRMWKPGAALSSIDRTEVEWLVRESLKGGRHPNTLRGKDLPLLHRAFVLAKLESPVPEVRQRMRSALKAKTLRGEGIDLEDVSAILDRMRHEAFLDSKGRELQLPSRRRHADLVQLLAVTGLRSAELCRVRVQDFRQGAEMLAVESPKDRANPREVPVPAAARPAVFRLIAQARGGVLVPGGMRTLSPMFQRWGKRLGIRLNARMLRSFYISHLLRSGAPPQVVRDLAGHRSLRTTNIYARGATHHAAPHVSALGDALGEHRPESGSESRRAQG